MRPEEILLDKLSVICRRKLSEEILFTKRTIHGVLLLHNEISFKGCPCALLNRTSLFHGIVI